MQTNTQDYFSKPKKEIMKKLVKHSSTFGIQMMIESRIFMDSKCDWPCIFSMQPFSDQRLFGPKIAGKVLSVEPRKYGDELWPSLDIYSCFRT